MKKEAKKVLKKYTDLQDELNKVAEEYKAIYYQDCYDYCYPKAKEFVKDNYDKDIDKITDKLSITMRAFQIMGCSLIFLLAMLVDLL